MTDTDLAFASIDEVARLFRKRKLSPVELTQLMLARIEKLNPKLNAYITVTADVALAQAKKAEAELFGPRGRKGYGDRGPLHGIPVSLKDNIYTKDIRTTAGSKILKDFVPQHDAAVWAKLKEAGAILLGKTNLHEFAYGVTTNNPHYGPTRNPWDLTRIPGGSSGGSAAAVAAGLCYASIGTDTGGSIRIPAALCGIVGFKPGIGRVDDEGVVPLSRTLDFVGPLARSVRDVSSVCEALFVRLEKDKYVGKKPEHLRNLKLGVPKELWLDVFATDVSGVFGDAIRFLQRQGATINELSIPLLKEVEEAGNQIAWAEATHYHQQQGWFPAHGGDYGADVLSRLESGARVSATSYLQALDTRLKFNQQLLNAMVIEAGVDAVVVPTVPITAPRIGEETTKIDDKDYPTRALLLRWNRPANLAHAPAVSIPCGVSNANLPVALQLIGLAPRDPLLLRIAHAVESGYPQTRRPTVAVV
jgi:aspartyl-tRNA(Asn)/glutamyl-tRNA(Gln) amidotransferase subunit A